MSTAVTTREVPGPRPGLPALELAAWGAELGLLAGITTRADKFNLGLLTGEPAAAVIERWRVLAGALAPAFPRIVVGLQVHGTHVAVHAPGDPGWTVLDAVDGHATVHPGILLGVTVADCVPVYLAHPPSGAIALLHAGWRGVAAGMLEAGIQTMRELVSADPGEIVMHCGVAICGTCYEVGPEVLAAVTGTAAERPARLDLRAVLVDRARGAGVSRVTVSEWCAAHDADRFFSHRRSGGRDGRMLAFLGRPVA